MTERPTPKQAISELSNFVEQVWMHPLLDQTTRDLRKRGSRDLSKLLKLINPELAYAAIPVGSAMHIMIRNSDIDFVIFTPHRANFPQFAQDLGAKIYDMVNITHVLSIENDKMSPAGLTQSDWKYNLLFTPDEFVTGDPIIAQKIRLDINKMLQNSDSKTFDTFYQGLIGYFDQVYKQWGTQTFFGGQEKQQQRQGRINTRLAEVAHQHPDPDTFIEQYRKQLKELTPPTMDVYTQALTATQGAINLPI